MNVIVTYLVVKSTQFLAVKLVSAHDLPSFVSMLDDSIADCLIAT